MKEYANIIYWRKVSKIGGVETFIYELAKKYDYDLALYYNSADENQIKRLIKLIPCVPYIKQKIKCKRIFVCNDTEILDTIEYEEAIQMIHGMYKTNKIEPNLDPRITKRMAVSQIAADEYYEITGIKPEVFSNPLTITEEDKKPALMLISATRLSSEKGGDRMLALSRILEEKKVNYVWLVFTDDKTYSFTNNMVKLDPTLDIRPYLVSIKGRGYCVQLSDGEGDPYITKECRAIGLPVLITPVPSFFEQGWEDGKNCYVLPFDMKNINVTKIVNEIPTVEPMKIDDEWDKLLVHKKTKYKEEMNMKFKVKALPTCKEYGLAPNECMEDGKKPDECIPEAGFVFEVERDRLEILLGNNAYGVAFVEKIEEVKEKATAESKPTKPSNKKK